MGIQKGLQDLAAAAKHCRFAILNLQAEYAQLKQGAKLIAVEPRKQKDQQKILKLQVEVLWLVFWLARLNRNALGSLPELSLFSLRVGIIKSGTTQYRE